MDASREAVSVWSYGLAAFVYAAFAIYLASGWRSGLRSRALFVVSVLCAFWGLAGLAFALTGQTIFLAIGMLADLFRYGGWFVFLLVLLKPHASRKERLPNRLRWLAGSALALVLIGLSAQIMAVKVP